MPLVYADTSALFAFFHPKDQFSTVLMNAVQRFSPDFVYWSFIRYELRHNLRQSRVDSYGEVAWAALRAAERTQAAPIFSISQQRGACINYLDWTSFGRATRSSRRPPKRQGCGSAYLPFDLFDRRRWQAS